MARLDQQQNEMEERARQFEESKNNAADDATVTALRAEIVALREQLGKAAAASHAVPGRGDPTFQMATGKHLENGVTTNGTNNFMNNAKRRQRRLSDPAAHDADQGVLPDEVDPRSVSMMPSGSGGFRAPGSTAYIPDEEMADPVEQIMFLLESDEALDEDVLLGLIQHLKIPNPSLSSPPFPKEVLFPAHLISLVTNEMWKYGLMNESERFLANVMQGIQQHVMVRCLYNVLIYCSELSLFCRTSKETRQFSPASSGFPTCTKSTLSFASPRVIFCRALVPVLTVQAATLTGKTTSVW